MSTENTNANAMFLNASRKKLRFDSSKGALSAEDLWDLPLTGKGANLDEIAVNLYKQLKNDTSELSFVKPATNKASNELQDKFDLVKFVIDTKSAERDAAAAASEKAAAKQKIMGLIAKKDEANLENMPKEELEKLLASM
jgi:hypothetical protein